MTDRPTDEGLASWIALLQAHAVLVEALERDLVREVGLPLAWFDVLAQLANAPERRLRMHELARTVLLSKSGLTRLVDRLAEAGLVQRAACAEDRRVIYTILTATGEEKLRGALPVHKRALDEHFTGHLASGELRSIRAVLCKLVEAHGHVAVPCPSAAALACAEPGAGSSRGQSRKSRV